MRMVIAWAGNSKSKGPIHFYKRIGSPRFARQKLVDIINVSHPLIAQVHFLTNRSLISQPE